MPKRATLAALGLALGLLFTPLAGCSPEPAVAAVLKPGELTGRLNAAGDTVTAAFFYRPLASPDSVACLFLLANAASVRVVRPGTATSCGPAVLVPTPAIVAGDSALVTVQWTAYKKNATPATVSGQFARYFKRPVPPPGVQPDSLTLSGIKIMRDPFLVGNAGSTWAPPGGSVRLCGALTFRDGRIGLRSIERADSTCARYFATTIGQLQRLQAVTYAGGTWHVASASTGRQAVLDGVCFVGSDGSVDTSAACRGYSAGLRLGAAFTPRRATS